MQQIDKTFQADAWGDYLMDTNEKLSGHQSAVLAAFCVTEKDLKTILEVVTVIDGGNPRLIDFKQDVFNLVNLSTIYRYVVLAKGLKMRVVDL